MPVKPVFYPNHLYFVTTSAKLRKQLFQRDVIKRILVESLNFIRVSGWVSLYAFVIMPNHLHCVVRVCEGHYLPDIMREFKKHTARQIIRQYQAEKNSQVLALLEELAEPKPRQQFKVWEDRYDARSIYSINFLRQKLEYLHNNPCQPHWQLVDRPEDYVWSSARYYLLDAPAVIAVDDVRDLLV